MNNEPEKGNEPDEGNEQEKVFSVNLDGGKPKLDIIADADVFCLKDATTESQRSGGAKMYCSGIFIVVVILVGSVGVAVCLKSLCLFYYSTKLALCEITKVEFNYSPWPFVVLTVASLAAIVALCLIGYRHALRMEKLAFEKWKQRFDMKRFLIEKSIDYAGKHAAADTKKDNTSAYSISITVNKNGTDKDSQPNSGVQQ